MPRITADQSAVIDAPAAKVYSIIADYHDGHPRILPPKYFRDLVVESGGFGAGTVIRFTTTIGGVTRVTRGMVSEPEPGRVLVESYPADGIVTTFVVEPAGDAKCEVTFRTEWTRGGLKGLVERLLAPSMLRRVYKEELANLARVANEMP